TKCVQSLDPRYVIHHAEGVTVDVEPSALETRPRTLALRYPPFKALVSKLAGQGVNFSAARVILLYKRAHHRGFVLLHTVPKIDVDRHSSCLDFGSYFGAVV